MYTKTRIDFLVLLKPEIYLKSIRDFGEKRGEACTIDNYFFDTDDHQLFYTDRMLRLGHYTEKDYSLSMIVPVEEHLTESLIISPLFIEDRNKLFNSKAIIKDNDFEKVLYSKLSKPVSYIGKVLTKRFTFQHFESVVKIDQNFFPGGYIDYEINFGVFDEKKLKEVEEIFNSFTSTYETEIPRYNKYQRLIGKLALASS